MYPPDPFPPPPGASPTRAAADLIHALTSHGITSIYTAAAAKLAVISLANLNEGRILPRSLILADEGSMISITHLAALTEYAAATGAS